MGFTITCSKLSQLVNACVIFYSKCSPYLYSVETSRSERVNGLIALQCKAGLRLEREGSIRIQGLV